MDKEWCTNCSLVSRHCSESVEYLSLKCRPLYLSRDFIVVLIVAVYIPPSANVNIALRELYDHICEL